MPNETNERYLRYLVARLAAYRNVWWSLANEYDLMKHLSIEDWDRYFQIVQQADPFDHPRSVHNWQILNTHESATFYDHGKPWVTHCSIQHAHLDRVAEWRERYQKPVVVDECCYEGDIPFGWGCISGVELVRRFWEGVARGGYAGHGETYVNPGDVLWWSRGGGLRGASPARLAFLRDILEAGPAPGLDPLPATNINEMPCAGQAGQYYLAYVGVYQPAELVFTLPEGTTFQADVIDTWNMTITPVEGVFEGRFVIPLPRQPYLAVRLRRYR
jgi:hypothetical protein